MRILLLIALAASAARAQSSPDTAAGGGTKTPVERRREDFRILDIDRDNAVAKIVASDWIDYLELARWNGQWKIVNVLWALTPKDDQPR
jgi:hypothetical protein